MNLENHATKEELADLIRPCKDHDGHHVLWVTKTGDVRISMVPHDRTPVGFELDQPSMQLRFETFEAGNDYVGPDAADDEGWVSDLFNRLCDEWAKAKGRRDVAYIDQL